VDLRNSGDTAGTRDRVVGYGAWAFHEGGTATAVANGFGAAVVTLARRAIAAALAGAAPPPVPADIAATLAETGACFVTLKRQGQLRGCIGTPIARQPLGVDLLENAVRAATADPRFPPVTAEELPGLSLSVSVLTPCQPMSFRDEADLLGQLRPGIDGLVIGDGPHRALFLPAVWETLPDRRQFLAHLKAKAGLAPFHWSPTFRADRFQAVEYDEAGSRQS
jgi:AmmeMemoRadiSam system protein A